MQIDKNSINDYSISELGTQFMELIKLARRARKNDNIKIRQPLATMRIITQDKKKAVATILFQNDIKEEANVKTIELLYDDLRITL